jgi:hypothetical protein
VTDANVSTPLAGSSSSSVQSPRIWKKDPKKVWAQNKVRWRVLKGELPPVKTQKCFHCGEPARDYDHFKGYAHRYRFHVLPVCRSCHRKLSWFRGELKRTPLMDQIGAKLSYKDALEIRRLWKRNVPGIFLARIYGVTPHTIYHIVWGQSHKDKV